jgi:hypothetical protein
MWNEATDVYADCLANAGIIRKVEFTHCSGDVNVVAHEIARSCLISKISCNWIDELPSFILQSFVNDVTII